VPFRKGGAACHGPNPSILRPPAMRHLKLLVISGNDETGAWLTRRLAAGGFEVTTALPGPTLIHTVKASRPHVAVLDRIDTRPKAAPMEVALLKDQSPGVQIIALSEHSSEIDAGVVEQGIFYYLAGRSREELLRVIEAAACEWRETKPLDSWNRPEQKR
jgi:DNA-binding response OmpR family regulator